MKKDKEQFADYWDSRIDYAFDKNCPWTALNQGASYCKDKHQTFYGAVTSSPQWSKWYEEQMKRFSELVFNKKTCRYDGKPTFDIDESEAVGAISQEHLQEFFKFIKDTK